MPFGRLHEEAAGEDKLLILTDAAWRMWGMGLIYCQKNLTDGFIDERAIEQWGIKATNKRRVADELCKEQVRDRSPLWARVDGGFQVHDYLQWNDSKAEIIKARAEGRDRVKKFRERDRLERERLRLLDTERNALHGGEQLAHHVVRGSGEDLQKEGDPKNRRGAIGRSDGVLAGSLPKDHLSHILCDDTLTRCVPRAVHEKLANLLSPKHNGDRVAAGAVLLSWYPNVWASLPADFVMPDAFKFWQARFDPVFASKDAASRSDQRASVPDADATRAYLRGLKNPDARTA